MEHGRESLAAREERLREAEARLKADREALSIEKERIQRQGWRDNIYGRINLSVKTVDRVIWVVGGLLVVAIIAGVLLK